MLIYADHEEPGGFRHRGAYQDQPANKIWRKHRENLMVLEMISKSPKDATERRQAEHEMKICRRKMEFWEKHVNFSPTQAQNDALEIKKLWSQS